MPASNQSFRAGDRVARVSLRSDEDKGKIGDAGLIERRFDNLDGVAFGYRVIWDDRPTEAQYVAPQRIVALDCA